ncbi:MAG: 2-dehydropantoate 2-reductase [Alphaproteobacteria bacterium]
MRICIFGAGAIGGYLAVNLANAGADVTCIARGPHLAAMRDRGLRLITGDEERVAHPRCTDDPAEASEQDYVIVTLKAHSIPPIAHTMAPLFGPDTALVTGQNGLPWWYFYKQGGPFDDKRLESVDPGGKQWAAFGPGRAIGSVVYIAAEVVEPGVIRHEYGTRLTLGEPDGSKSERVRALSTILIAAGIKAPVKPAIRNEIWVKLWGNLSFNPVSALTQSTLKTLAEDADVRPVIRAMMVEAQAIGEAIGVRFPIDVDARIAGAAEVGEHRTSMLQDLDLGRPMEIDAMVTVIQELGHLTELPTPTIDTVLGLVKLRARTAGCYSG